jgi:hypothetical protein
MLAVFATAGCGSSGVTANSTSNATGTVVSPPPSWAAALGTGVTVSPPPPTGVPAADTPAAAVLGYVRQLATRYAVGACLYLMPAYQTKGCEVNNSQPNPVRYDAVGIGYTAFYNGLALVVLTHTHLCVGKSCIADNSDPAALLDSGKAFVALLDEAVSPGKLPGSKIFPCIQGDGVWYLDFTQ